MTDFFKKAWKWLDNFWYHHKWKTLILSFFAIVIIICTVQMCNKEEYDAHIIYAGPATVSLDDYKMVTAGFADLMPDDFNGDGVKIVDFTNIVYVPQEMAEEYREKGLNFDPLRNAQAQTQFQTEMMNGQCLICLLDPDLYLATVDKGFFRPLSEVLEHVPDYAVDDYAILAADLPYFRRTDCGKFFPDDTVVCLRVKNSVYGKTSKTWDDLYAFHEDFFRTIVTYGTQYAQK